jgi:hypothetical protein
MLRRGGQTAVEFLNSNFFLANPKDIFAAVQYSTMRPPFDGNRRQKAHQISQILNTTA